MAAATFCGQALGRGDVEDAYRWAWDVFRTCWWVFGVLALPMLLASGPVLEAFFGDPDTVQDAARLIGIGKFPLQMIGAAIVLDSLGFILMQSLLGVGASSEVMLVSIGLQWLLFLPLCYLLGPVLNVGLLSIWGLLIVYRAAQTLIFIELWRGRGWARIRV